jgi:hypothetical protein
MKRKLLLRAAEILKDIPKNRFDLDRWIKGDAEARIISGKKVTKEAKCGTIACAGGWLGLTKEFNDRGLKFVKYEGMSNCPTAELVFEKNGETINDAFEALMETFDIGYAQADALFTASGIGDYDDEIYKKHGYDISDHELFQYRVKKVINEAKKGRK